MIEGSGHSSVSGPPRARAGVLLAIGLSWLAAHVFAGASPAAAQEVDAPASGEAQAVATPETAQSDDDFDFDSYEDLEGSDDDEDDAAVFEDDPAEESPYGDVETIVVTGTASQSSGDLEASNAITSFDSEELGSLGVQDVSDLAAFTPNLEIVTAGATTPTFFIRGVGLNDFNSNSTGAVAIYQDDVAINAPAMQLPSLFDVEAVNVLRGPQGTGLARNASAGAIKIYSRKPTGDFGGYLRAEAGNYNFIDFEGAVNAPVYGDSLAARFAFRFSARDGTMENRCAGAPPIEDRIEVPTTGQLRALGKTNADEPWSHCGEPVLRLAPGPYISDIPEGLASRVNDIGNWAVRGTLLWEPTETQQWLLGFKASKRDEYARLGQSIGTFGFTCADGDVINCGYPLSGGTRDSRIEGQLGGSQGASGYRPIEIKQRLIELAPCNEPIPGRPGGTCSLPDAQGGDRALDNAAKVQLANELAAGLDSEPWAGDFNHTGKTTNDTLGAFLKGDIELADRSMTLSTVTGYDHYDRVRDLDLDFSPETLFHVLTDDRGWQVTESLKLQGGALDETVRWDVGGWFLAEELNVGVYNDLGRVAIFAVGARDYTQNMFSVAGYASLAWDFWDKFTLDGGFRYNWEKKKLDYALMTGAIAEPFVEKLDESWGAPTGTVRLTYRFRPDTTVFAKYTRGWKPGTFNATGSLATGVSVADPETIDSYEAGVSGSWFDDRVGLSANFFYYAYDDYQLFTAQQYAGGNPEFVIINAEASEMYGSEIDSWFAPWELGNIGFRFSWLESQFLDFVQTQQEIISVGGAQKVVNRELQNTGNQVLNAPRFNVTLTGQQGLDMGKWGIVTGRYDGVWTSTNYYDATEGRGIPNVDNVSFLPANTIAQEAYWMHNIRVSFSPDSDRFELAFWVRNVTNKAVKSFAFDGSTFNNTSIYFVGDPRTFGGTANFNF